MSSVHVLPLALQRGVNVTVIVPRCPTPGMRGLMLVPPGVSGGANVVLLANETTVVFSCQVPARALGGKLPAAAAELARSSTVPTAASAAVASRTVRSRRITGAFHRRVWRR